MYQAARVFSSLDFFESNFCFVEYEICTQKRKQKKELIAPVFKRAAKCPRRKKSVRVHVHLSVSDDDRDDDVYDDRVHFVFSPYSGACVLSRRRRVSVLSRGDLVQLNVSNAQQHP